MILDIILKNFLSYESVQVNMSDDTVAVVGDNGQGKSSLLESIAFCLYGVSRYKTLSQLVRRGVEDDMVVEIRLSGVVEGETLRVVRGYNPKKEAGYLRVYVGDGDGELKAKGGATSTNNSAQAYINKVLGVDVHAFLLTAFFGLGGSDSLMKVTPAEKLEMLQRLAGASQCKEINELAGKERKAIEQKILVEERALDVLQGTVTDVGVLEEKVSSLRDQLAASLKKLEVLDRRKDEFEVVVNDRRALEVELDKLTGRREAMESSVKSMDKATGILSTRIEELQKAGTAYTGKIKEVQAFLDKFDAPKIMLELEERAQRRAELVAEDKLLVVGADVSVSSTCPMCGHEVDAAIKQSWADRRVQLENDIKSLTEDIRAKSNVIGEIKKAQASLATCTVERDAKIRALEEARAAVDATETEKRSVMQSIEALGAEIKAAEEKLAGFGDHRADLRAISREAEQLTATVATVRNEIKHTQNAIEESQRAQVRVNDVRARLFEMRKSVREVALVEEAFSRYAIPMEMLKRLRKDIEVRASALYREFTEGNIVIEDTEGARPGVEFVLVDGIGERPYDGLSEGEKTMFSLAVRIAVTQRENKLHDSKVDFLVLDEVSSHLSEAKRDALTAIIQKILKKYFGQIFMVSHAPMREIFSRTLEVRKVDGVSQVVSI